MAKYIIGAAAAVLVASAVFGFSVRLAVLALVVMFIAALVAVFKRQ
jgi:hypothetical protein